MLLLAGIDLIIGILLYTVIAPVSLFLAQCGLGDLIFGAVKIMSSVRAGCLVVIGLCLMPLVEVRGVGLGLW